MSQNLSEIEIGNTERSYFLAVRVKYSVSRFEWIWEMSMGGQRARTVEPSSAT